MEELTTISSKYSFCGPFTINSTSEKGYYNVTINNVKVENQELEEKFEKYKQEK